MRIKQTEIIDEVAKNLDIDRKIVWQVFKSTEKYIFKHLSLASDDEDIEILPLKGLVIKSCYDMMANYPFTNNEGGKRVTARARITKQFNKKLNSKPYMPF